MKLEIIVSLEHGWPVKRSLKSHTKTYLPAITYSLIGKFESLINFRGFLFLKEKLYIEYTFNTKLYIEIKLFKYFMERQKLIHEKYDIINFFFSKV